MSAVVDKLLRKTLLQSSGVEGGLIVCGLREDRVNREDPGERVNDLASSSRCLKCKAFQIFPSPN